MTLEEFLAEVRRCADPTEMTGDGALEEMEGPASRELWARIGRLQEALERFEEDA